MAQLVLDYSPGITDYSADLVVNYDFKLFESLDEKKQPTGGFFSSGLVIEHKKIDVRLFGELEFDAVGKRKKQFSTNKSAALFAFLVLNPDRVFTREYLAECLWPSLERGNARKCLRTDLWRIRKILEQHHINSNDVILVSKNNISLSKDMSFSVDVNYFEKKVQYYSQCGVEKLKESDYQKLKYCLSLYRGELLEHLFFDWFDAKREALRLLYLTALELALRYNMLHKAWSNAIAYGHQLLALDPFLEDIHLAVMQCQYNKGNRPAAINQYQRCCTVLSEELGVSPMQSTQYVYQNILQESL